MIVSSENIWADLDSPGVKNPPRLFLCAHYDSKSQTLKLKSRIYWLRVGIGSMFLLLVVFLTYAFHPFPWLFPAADLFTFTGAVVAVRFMIVETGNDSPGALDNASGVGTVLACAEYFAQNPPGNISLRFLLVGAEEYGLQGAVYHVQNHACELAITFSSEFRWGGASGGFTLGYILNAFQTRYSAGTSYKCGRGCECSP